ncbi:hypothetical protein E2C01_081549 [Portunus trituberculatus]|uniref:Uncharacterized protein n=1 Tax=Portunus trituberculatus TaxID=210409 RepID=A0A5B7IWN1_PORTR|nr:hypothetical protein [Portunus trituberculatus]
MLDLGEDPRCFISWENPPKFVFFGFQLLKDNLIDDYGSFCNGAAFLMLFFSTTWIFGFFCYIRLSRSSLDFYPIFQVLNSWTVSVLCLFSSLPSSFFLYLCLFKCKRGPHKFFCLFFLFFLLCFYLFIF